MVMEDMVYMMEMMKLVDMVTSHSFAFEEDKRENTIY
jgi:hypothetical protein